MGLSCLDGSIGSLQHRGVPWRLVVHEAKKKVQIGFVPDLPVGDTIPIALHDCGAERGKVGRVSGGSRMEHPVASLGPGPSRGIADEPKDREMSGYGIVDHVVQVAPVELAALLFDGVPLDRDPQPAAAGLRDSIKFPIGICWACGNHGASLAEAIAVGRDQGRACIGRAQRDAPQHDTCCKAAHCVHGVHPNVVDVV